MVQIIEIIWEIFGGGAVVLFVCSGFFFFISRDKPDRIAKAKMFFIWSVVFVVMAIVAYSVVKIFQAIF